MKLRKIYLLLLGIVFISTSCNNYLDLSPTDTASDKLVWSDSTYAQLAVNDFYHYLYYLGSFNTGDCAAGMTEGLTDIFKYGSSNYNALCYIPSEITYGGSTLSANYVDVYLGTWSTVYGYIRRVNEAMAKMNQYGSYSDSETKYLEGQMRFFRGFLYFNLMKRYKEVVLYNEDMSKYAKSVPLSTEAEGWDFIESDLKYAAENLPANSTPDNGITKGAAYAMLSRAMLYAERWDVAKAAADSVISSKLYKLTSNYSDAFDLKSSEAILQYAFDQSNFSVYHDFDGYYAPGGDKAKDGNVLNGGYGTPTQELVESYELADGSGFPDWSEWHTTTGTTDTPPYDKLEPRFAATVLYNGSKWKNRTIEPYVDGTDGWCTWLVDAAPEGRTTTGYYLRKLVDENHSFSTTQNSTQPWTVLRYAEVLLNYAEACYQTGDEANANAAVREIRDRVGLPYTDKSGTDLMAAIRQERKVELSFEDLYYWDMRRWKLAASAFSGYRTHGLKVEKNADGSFTYTYVECDAKNREFPSKMYRFPLPTSEVENNSSVSQFSDWK